MKPLINFEPMFLILQLFKEMTHSNFKYNAEQKNTCSLKG